MDFLSKYSYIILITSSKLIILNFLINKKKYILLKHDFSIDQI